MGVRSLLDLLDLQPVGIDHFTAPSPGRGNGRLFGGQVMAQALQAARLTVDEPWPVHSMHAYFLRPGAIGETCLLEVQRARDGRSFLSRRVNVSQHAGVILTLDASFHRPEAGSVWEHPGLAGAPTPSFDEADEDRWDRLSEKRQVPKHRQERGRATSWLRAVGPLPDDPLLHQVALVYISDRAPMAAVRRALPPDEAGLPMIAASLDHAMWFHAPAPADEWLVFDMQATALADNRGVAVGTCRTGDGRLVATVAQECLMRPVREDRPAG